LHYDIKVPKPIIDFTSSPNVYIATLTQNTPTLTSTLSIYNINNCSTGWTSAPTVNATATVAITAVTLIQELDIQLHQLYNLMEVDLSILQPI
jgi:hypothetical protein